MGQALPPVSVVTIGSNPFSLLPKQVEGLDPWCPKTVCPPFLPSGLIQRFWIMILHEKCRKTVYYTTQFINFEPKLHSGLVCHQYSKLLPSMVCPIQADPTPFPNWVMPVPKYHFYANPIPFQLKFNCCCCSSVFILLCYQWPFVTTLTMAGFG